ncbi:MAG TPA: hypothetical protein VLG37_04180 [Candidatus Saccharimonadales bacterium]|nr:hypothetical protein [Candidatus Saccharimonadales bacterium]
MYVDQCFEAGRRYPITETRYGFEAPAEVDLAQAVLRDFRAYNDFEGRVYPLPYLDRFAYALSPADLDRLHDELEDLKFPSADIEDFQEKPSLSGSSSLDLWNIMWTFANPAAERRIFGINSCVPTHLARAVLLRELISTPEAVTTALGMDLIKTLTAGGLAKMKRLGLDQAVYSDFGVVRGRAEARVIASGSRLG